MKLTLAPIAAALSLVVAVPVFADEPEQENTQQAAQAESVIEATDSAEAQAADASTAIENPAISTPAQELPAAAEEPEEETVICRSVRLDMSSRRKTRICRTEEGWRELNQQR